MSGTNAHALLDHDTNIMATNTSSRIIQFICRSFPWMQSNVSEEAAIKDMYSVVWVPAPSASCNAQVYSMSMLIFNPTGDGEGGANCKYRN